jgi:hypothetical protein
MQALHKIGVTYFLVTLLEFLLDGRLDQQTYDEQVQPPECGDCECQRSVHRSGHGMHGRRGRHWIRRTAGGTTQTIVVEQKQRLQRVFFRNGVTYTADGFGTAATNSFFTVFRMFSVEKATLASPTGFELVLPP